MSSDNCSVAHQVAEEGGGIGCEVAKNTRTVLQSGDDYPRLWTGEEARKEPNIKVGALNADPRSRNRGYESLLRPEGQGGKQGVAAASGSKADGSTNADPEEAISFNFDRAPLSYFLKQMLGGALGLNYIAPDDITGTVTFKSEQPVPKSQALPVIKDILARNGFRMRLSNGVYQIEASENGKGGPVAQIGDDGVRTIDLPRGNGVEVATMVRQLAPEGVSVIPSRSGDSVTIRGASIEIDQVAELAKALSQRGGNDDRVAIIPLQQVGPGQVASRLTELYRQRLGAAGGDVPTIIPLENQQSILVGVRDPQMMASLKRLVQELDRNGDLDEPTVRIIPLTHLSAEDVTKRLGAIFGVRAAGISDGGPQNGAATGGGSPMNGGGGPSGFGGVGGSGGAGSQQYNGANMGDGAVGPGNYQRTSNDAAPSSTAAPGYGDGGMERGGAGQGGGPGPGVNNGVRLVADTRNNAVMVFSNYAMFKRIREVLRTLDVPQAQVVLEATIAEVTLTDDLQFGVQAFLAGNGIFVRSGVDQVAPALPSRSGLFAAVGGNLGPFNASVVLHALQKVTKVKVISSPYVTVLDGKTARLMIGDQIPYTQSSQASTSNLGGGTTITNAVQIKDTGLILEVTPRINANNAVSLTIDQTLSAPLATSSSIQNTPVISTRQVKSDVLTQSGRTILLAGLIQERMEKGDEGVPLLRQVPGVGELFKTQSNTESRTKLLILMTPRVVRQSPQIEQITRLFRDQLHVH